jgi:hypothetical protein
MNCYKGDRNMNNNNNNKHNIFGQIALVLVVIAIIGSITSACDNGSSKKDFLNSLSPKEYYAFSQRAYAYNHRND